MQIHRAEVVSVDRLTPGMQRIVLGGPGLADFTTTGVGDEYLRVFLPEPGQAEPVLPRATEDSWEYEDDVTPGPMRTYTVRGTDPSAGTVTIDFVVHEGGAAATWALAAAPGDVVGLNSPTGLYAAPGDITWRLILADATGLPAAGRLIEQGSHDVRTRAVLEVAEDSHRQELSAPGTQISWMTGGNAHGPSRIEAALRAVELPSGPGYVWVAGETRVCRAVRKYLRHELTLPAATYKVVGYWTERAEEWTARWDALDEGTREWLDNLWESDEDLEVIEDRYDEKLAELGL